MSSKFLQDAFSETRLWLEIALVKRILTLLTPTHLQGIYLEYNKFLALTRGARTSEGIVLVMLNHSSHEHFPALPQFNPAGVHLDVSLPVPKIGSTRLE